MATKKKSLGQFYTTNYDYILQNMSIPANITTIIEPFTGNADLIKFIQKQDYTNIIECYDIDPKKDFIIQRDTLNNPPNYQNKFIITNPPYLARNKSSDKSLFDKYDVNDLYKCLIKELLVNVCVGGILILPLNFWSSIRTSDIELRKAFLFTYKIIILNIFEEQVFDDTTYTTCSFQFELKNEPSNNQMNIVVYPSKLGINTCLNDENNYMIGGEIYNLTTTNEFKISRLTKKNIDKKNSNIIAKCIDDNATNQIGLYLVEDKDVYVDNTPNQTARTYATLIIEPKLEINQQIKLVEKFNEFLTEHRRKYNSLFLTNYREHNRKRISFDLVYLIIQHILD